MWIKKTENKKNNNIYLIWMSENALLILYSGTYIKYILTMRKYNVKQVTKKENAFQRRKVSIKSIIYNMLRKCEC